MGNCKIISLIAAADEHLAIGRGGDMPWHISADLKYFKQVTSGCSVIMGRKTWESIGSRPLPKRRNIVVSKQLIANDATNGTINTEAAGETETSVVYCDSLESALTEAASDEVFIMGGGSIYAQALPMADRIYLTEIRTVVEDADTFFPDFREMRDGDGTLLWRESWRSEVLNDERSGLSFEFVRYENCSR